MSDLNRRRKQEVSSQKPKALICNKCRRRYAAESARGKRCYCVEVQERSAVVGRRRKKRAVNEES